MKIAIVTLPLHTNYGGVLQAYALKTVLENMGHEAQVLDLEKKVLLPKTMKAPFIYLKRLLQKCLNGKRGPEVLRECRLRREYPVVSSKISSFTADYVKPRVLKSYSQVQESDYDAYVVGSDQIWRPEYFRWIKDAFLDFAKGWDVRRLSYAASFGTDELEYDYLLLDECSRLLSQFDAVSVREASGVRICDEWFDYENAVHVLDPVMLLPLEHYASIAAKAVSCNERGGIVTYILDRSAAKSNIASFVSRVTGMELNDVSVYPQDRNIPLADRVVPPMEEWLCAFVNADFVVTDSFHGCVLSILFHKPFLVTGNKTRGMARIETLLETFSLENRLVDGIDPDDDGQGWLMEIDWDKVDAVLEERRNFSMDFLRGALK